MSSSTLSVASPVKKIEAQTVQIEQCEQKINQSASGKTNEPQSQVNKTNKTSSLLPHLNTVDQNKINVIQADSETTMDFRRIEQIERDDASEETQNLTNRWKEVVKPGEYRTSNGVWKNYNPPRHHRAEIKRSEVTLNQRRIRLLRISWRIRIEILKKKLYEENNYIG